MHLYLITGIKSPPSAECGQWGSHSVRLLLVGQMFWHPSGERFVTAQAFINNFPNTAVWEVKCQLLTASTLHICLPAPFHLCQRQTCLICIYAPTICLWTFRCSMFCAQRIWITAHTYFLVLQFSSSVGSLFFQLTLHWHCVSCACEDICCIPAGTCTNMWQRNSLL